MNKLILERLAKLSRFKATDRTRTSCACQVNTQVIGSGTTRHLQNSPRARAFSTSLRTFKSKLGGGKWLGHREASVESIYDAQPAKHKHRRKKYYRGSGKLKGKAELLEDSGERIDLTIDSPQASAAYSAVPTYGAGVLMRPDVASAAIAAAQVEPPAGLIGRIRQILGLSPSHPTVVVVQQNRMRPRTGRSEASVTAVPGMSQRSISRKGQEALSNGQVPPNDGPRLQFIRRLTGNLGPVFTLIAYGCSDVLYLRVFMSAGTLMSIVFNAAHRPPIWIPIWWSLFFILLNAVMVYRLLQERADVEFTEEQMDCYEAAFQPHGWTPRQFQRLLRAGAQFRDVEEGDEPVKEGQTTDEVVFLVSGAADMEVAGKKIGTLTQGSFLTSLACLLPREEAEAAEAVAQAVAAREQQQERQRADDEASGLHQAVPAVATGVASAVRALSPVTRPDQSSNPRLGPSDSASAPRTRRAAGEIEEGDAKAPRPAESAAPGIAVPSLPSTIARLGSTVPDLGRVAAALRLAHDSPAASRDNRRAEEAAVDAAADEVLKEDEDRKRRRDRDAIGSRVGDVMRSVSSFDQDVRDSLGIGGEARRGGVYGRSEVDPDDRDSRVETAAVFMRARARQGAVANQIRRMLEDAETREEEDRAARGTGSRTQTAEQNASGRRHDDGGRVGSSAPSAPTGLPAPASAIAGTAVAKKLPAPAETDAESPASTATPTTAPASTSTAAAATVPASSTTTTAAGTVETFRSTSTMRVATPDSRILVWPLKDLRECVEGDRSLQYPLMSLAAAEMAGRLQLATQQMQRVHRYRERLQAIIQHNDGTLRGSDKRELADLRERLGVADAEHWEALHALGWTRKDYLNGYSRTQTRAERARAARKAVKSVRKTLEGAVNSITGFFGGPASGKAGAQDDQKDGRQ